MARKPASEVRSVPETAPQAAVPEVVPETPATATLDTDSFILEIPVCDAPPHVHHPQNVHVRFRGVERKALADLTTALQRSHATLEDGKHVDTSHEAVRWLMQQIARR